MKTSWEDIERLTRFCKAYRERRPNSPIVRGVKDEAGEPIHLDIADLEALIEAGKDQLPLRDKMKLWETRAWRYDPTMGQVIVIPPTKHLGKVEARIEAGL